MSETNQLPLGHCKFVVFLDADNQNRKALQALQSLTDAADAWELIAAGTPQRIVRVDDKYRGKPGFHCLNALPRLKNAADFAIAVEAARLIDGGRFKDYAWLFISHNPGFEVLAENARKAGLEARYVPELIGQVGDLVGLSEDSVSFTYKLRALAKEMASGRKAVLIADFADEACERWPALKDKEFRNKVWGCQKFRSILNSIGIGTRDKDYLDKSGALRNFEG